MIGPARLSACLPDWINIKVKKIKILSIFKSNLLSTLCGENSTAQKQSEILLPKSTTYQSVAIAFVITFSSEDCIQLAGDGASISSIFPFFTLTLKNLKPNHCYTMNCACAQIKEDFVCALWLPFSESELYYVWTIYSLLTQLCTVQNIYTYILLYLVGHR